MGYYATSSQIFYLTPSSSSSPTMSSSTVSKRLCAVIPRQTRALSLYSHPHLTLDSVPPPQPYARPSPVATSRTPTSQSSSPHSQTQPSQPLTPSAPLQTIPSPLPRSAGQSSNSNSQVSLFPSTSFFPSNFPYFTPGSLHAPVVKRSRLTYQLNTGAYGIPKRRAHTIAASAELDLAVQVGEDAYFLRPDAMGVADGVGGWSKAAPATANSALFSKSLMHYCSYELSMLASPPAPPVVAHVDAHVSTIPDIHPIDILQRSYNRCLRSFQKQGFTGGSATALLALLRDEELRIAHLGDCALCLIRDGGIIYRSEEMQHAVCDSLSRTLNLLLTVPSLFHSSIIHYSWDQHHLLCPFKQDPYPYLFNQMIY